MEIFFRPIAFGTFDGTQTSYFPVNSRLHARVVSTLGFKMASYLLLLVNRGQFRPGPLSKGPKLNAALVACNAVAIKQSADQSRRGRCAGPRLHGWAICAEHEQLAPSPFLEQPVIVGGCGRCLNPNYTISILTVNDIELIAIWF
jgi:hypothetical protein